MAQRRSLDYSTEQYNTGAVTPQTVQPQQAVPRQPAGAPMPTTVGPSDYYSALNDYLNQGYTGAQAVGMAAAKFPSNAPGSAKDYASSDAYQQAAALPKGQSVGQQTSTGSFTMPSIDPSNPASLQAAIVQGYTAAYGHAPDQATISYWESHWPDLTARGAQLGDPQYAWKRLLGYEAGGTDQALYGPYAGGQGYTLNPNEGATCAFTTSKTNRL